MSSWKSSSAAAPADPFTRRRRLRSGLHWFLVATLVLVCSGRQAVAQGANEEVEPGLVVEEVIVTPDKPGPDTLCSLEVKVSNQGSEKASQLDFKVKINGQALAAYRNQIFMFPIAPGTSEQIKLYNFWSTETSRPFPASAKLIVEVSLVDAQWMQIRDVEGVETWQPLGQIQGLPSTATRTVKMSKP